MKTRPTLAIVSLNTREMPVQKRAQARVFQILQATADLLCVHTVSELSTTLIAETARIPVSSIYRYFPSVDAIVDEIYLQTTGEIDVKLFNVFSNTQTYPGWRDRLRGVLTTLRHYFQEHPHYRQVLRDVVARSGPLTIDTKKQPSLTAFLTDRWMAGEDNFSGADPVVTAQVSVQIFLAVEGLLVSQVASDMADKYFAALAINLESYLSNFLSD